MNNNIDDIETYFDIVQERDNLLRVSEDVDDRLRSTFDVAISTAQKQISDAEHDQALLTELIHMGLATNDALRHIELLQDSVELGLISQEQLDQAKDEVLDPRSMLAYEVAKRWGVAINQLVVDEESIPGAEVEISGESSASTCLDTEGPNPEAKKDYPVIKITVFGDGVQIGERGKFVKLSKAYGKGQHDYSSERLALLKTLVENAGEEIKSKDLWRLSLGEEVPFDKDSMRQIRIWFDNLTYRRAPIVKHNGKRGPSSAYIIDNPNISIDEVRKTKPKTQPAIEKRDSDIGIDQRGDGFERGGLDRGVIRLESIDQDSKPEKSIVYFPLSHAESVLLAEFLEMNTELLDDMDMTDHIDGICDRLRRRFNPSKIIEAIVNNGGSLEKARVAIISKVDAYFSDDNLEEVFNDLDNMERLDNRYPLFEYLIDLDSDQRKFLLDKLALSVPYIEVKEDVGSFNRGRQVIDAQTGRIDKYGNKIGSAHQDKPTEYILELDDTEELEIDHQDDGVSDEEATVIDEGDNTIVPIDDTQEELKYTSQVDDISEESECHEVERTETEIFSEEVKDCIDEVLDLIDRYSLDGKSRGAIQGVEGMGFMTIAHVKNSSENNLISRNDSKHLTRLDIVMLTLKYRFPKAFTVKKSNKKPNLRLLMNIIDSRLAEV